MKQTLLITTILSGLLSISNSYAQTCTAAPDCTSLGYTITDATVCTSKNLKFLACPFDETKGVCTTDGGRIRSCTNMGYTDDMDLCPGGLLYCPHDYGKVKCIQDAQVGDLKYSWQTKNFDGWLLCDGSTFSSKQFPELYALLGTTTLPNYQDGAKVNPENYPANIFIYAGKKAVRDGQRDKCKVGEWAKGTTNLNGGLKVTGCVSSSYMGSSLGFVTAINSDTLTIVSVSARDSAALAASSLEDCQNTFGGSLLSPTQIEERQSLGSILMLAGIKDIIYEESGTLVSQRCTGRKDTTTGVWSFSCNSPVTLSTLTSYTLAHAYCSYETNNAENTSVTWDWK